MRIPEKGIARKEIMGSLESYREKDVKWRDGKVFAYTFLAGSDGEEVVKEAYMKYLSENALDPTSFPSLVRMEREVVRMIVEHLRGDETVVGNFTSGGTESIMLAMKTARDRAAALRPEVKQPEVVFPRTAHIAFHKAAHYLGVKPVITEFDPVTFKANVDEMRAAINENTILLCASAPGYAQGVVDPIPEIGQLALERGLLFHVDACMGGIMLPFMRELGFPVPEFDFTVPGVTSISADMHKFGFAAKGASVVMHRNKDIRKSQIFAGTSSTTYALINATMLSSKSGGPVAGSWAILHYLGREGYKKIFKEIMNATRKMIDGINATGDLRALGGPDMCIFSFASDTVNVFQLGDLMAKKGWYLQPQFSTDRSPHNLHITMCYQNVPMADEFIKDLNECLDALKKQGNKLDMETVRAQVKMMMESLGPGAVEQLKALSGMTGTELPEDTAAINAMLDALPKKVSEALLVEFANELFS